MTSTSTSLSSALASISNNIGYLVRMAGTTGVVKTVNAIMSTTGSVINGIPGGVIPTSLSGIIVLLPGNIGVNVANSISLANGGGIQQPPNPTSPL